MLASAESHNSERGSYPSSKSKFELLQSKKSLTLLHKFQSEGEQESFITPWIFLEVNEGEVLAMFEEVSKRGSIPSPYSCSTCGVDALIEHFNNNAYKYIKFSLSAKERLMHDETPSNMRQRHHWWPYFLHVSGSRLFCGRSFTSLTKLTTGHG